MHHIKQIQLHSVNDVNTKKKISGKVVALYSRFDVIVSMTNKYGFIPLLRCSSNVLILRI